MSDGSYENKARGLRTSLSTLSGVLGELGHSPGPDDGNHEWATWARKVQDAVQIAATVIQQVALIALESGQILADADIVTDDEQGEPAATSSRTSHRRGAPK